MLWAAFFINQIHKSPLLAVLFQVFVAQPQVLPNKQYWTRQRTKASQVTPKAPCGQHGPYGQGQLGVHQVSYHDIPMGEVRQEVWWPKHFCSADVEDVVLINNNNRIITMVVTYHCEPSLGEKNQPSWAMGPQEFGLTQPTYGSYKKGSFDDVAPVAGWSPY